jgi:fermentation-respiration switch protein FrsA (DUF1100 family)
MTSSGLESGQTQTRRVRRWRLVLLLVLCLQPLILFIALQRRLIYHPLREIPDLQRATLALRKPINPVRFTTEDGLQLTAWLIPAMATGARDPASAVADERPLCIWFNGNAGHRAHRLPQVSLIHKADAHVLIADYRGYAENPGSPSEEGLASDARAVWKYARDTLKVPANRIIICGESLGGGVATRHAADLCESGSPPGGLFLQATFSSLVEAGAHHYPWLPVNWALRDRFDSLSRIAKVTCPIVMVHGRKDGIVPFKQGKKLFDAAPAKSASGVPKSFVELPEAGHNDIMDPEVGAIPLYAEALEGLIEKVAAAVEPAGN